jgi:hypothetical protein
VQLKLINLKVVQLKLINLKASLVRVETCNEQPLDIYKQIKQDVIA